VLLTIVLPRTVVALNKSSYLTQLLRHAVVHLGAIQPQRPVVVEH